MLRKIFILFTYCDFEIKKIIHLKIKFRHFFFNIKAKNKFFICISLFF